MPDPADPVAVRAWLDDHAPHIAAVRAWSVRLLAPLESAGAVPELGTPAWVTLADTDPRKLAAALRPALAYLLDGTPAAVTDRLRTELDAFATAWRRAHKEASAELSRYVADRGYSVGPSHAELDRRRQLTSTAPCGVCGAAVTLRHPLPDSHAARLPDLSWVRCTSCAPAAQPGQAAPPAQPVGRRSAA
ncbi:DUF2742 domain-containing protein [Actinophytocola sp.]|uniref:DUF2742 domain-containing protein n=1 Tax=Actinophytocola sp. TaxID=1872138 RepID=UPI0025C6133D|nr:DUF2742 domain-containing protein [Actinophytocola sp.]